LSELKAWKCDVCKKLFVENEFGDTYGNKSTASLLFSETENYGSRAMSYRDEEINFVYKDVCSDCRTKLLNAIEQTIEELGKDKKDLL
jgi:hypothetical protein